MPMRPAPARMAEAINELKEPMSPAHRDYDTDDETRLLFDGVRYDACIFNRTKGLGPHAGRASLPSRLFLLPTMGGGAKPMSCTSEAWSWDRHSLGAGVGSRKGCHTEWR